MLAPYCASATRRRRHFIPRTGRNPIRCESFGRFPIHMAAAWKSQRLDTLFGRFGPVTATRNPVPPGPNPSGKPVKDLSDWVRRGRTTGPRRTGLKLGHTQLIRQALVAESESNTKSCASGVNSGDYEDDSRVVSEVSDKPPGFRKRGRHRAVTRLSQKSLSIVEEL